MEAFGTKMRPRSLSKSVLKNEAKKHKKMHHFSTLFGAIWAPKIIKIKPRASKRPPEEQQAHKKRPRGTKSIKNAEKLQKKKIIFVENTLKILKINVFYLINGFCITINVGLYYIIPLKL